MDSNIQAALETNQEIRDLEAEISEKIRERGQHIRTGVDKGVPLNDFATAFGLTYPRLYHMMKQG